MISVALFLSSWSVLIPIYHDAVWRHWCQMCLLILIGSLCVKGMWRRPGVSFTMGRKWCMRSRCVLTHCEVAWSGTMKVGPSSCLWLCISYSFLSLTPSLLLSLFYLLSTSLSGEKLTCPALEPRCFFLVPPKEKDDPDNGNERIPAVGSDQLTLTSVPDQPHFKYKTDTHAYCIWMPILWLEILNFCWQGISRGLSFMYILKFMKFQHIKVDVSDFGIQITLEISLKKNLVY